MSQSPVRVDFQNDYVPGGAPAVDGMASASLMATLTAPCAQVVTADTALRA